MVAVAAGYARAASHVTAWHWVTPQLARAPLSQHGKEAESVGFEGPSFL